VGTRRRRRKWTDVEPGAGSVDLGPLKGYVGFMLRRVQSAVFADFIAQLAAVELRPAQYALLEVIDANPGLKQSDAAAALGIQKANFVALVSELEARSLLLRRRSQSDRRSYALFLEPGGLRLLERARRLHSDHESRLAAQLGTAGRDRLLSLLNRLAEPA
jgi:DNA-binding MarR family transcriptional regulator